MRHGSTGTVGLGGQRVPVRVPRVRSVAGIPLRSYDELSPGGAVNELLLRRFMGSPAGTTIGRGSDSRTRSDVDQVFVDRRVAKLREMQAPVGRSVAICVDGKAFPDAMMVVARYRAKSALRLRGDREHTDSVSGIEERRGEISDPRAYFVDGGKGLASQKGIPESSPSSRR